jgi:release factor glutamine methyltransferase
VNAQRHDVAGQIRFVQSDLLLPCSGEPLPRLHMVVSNPPYVSTRDATVAPEVRPYEPCAAVFAGESGVEVYQRLIPQAAQALLPGGCLVLELGYDVQERVARLLSPVKWSEVEWRKDLAGIMRVVTARRVD